jgi:hypothetical protein
MKQLVVILLMLAGAAGLLSAAEQTVDVVYLKDGSVLRGTIVERQTYPVEGIVLRTADGQDIPIPMDRIQPLQKPRGPEPGGLPGLGGRCRPMLSRSTCWASCSSGLRPFHFRWGRADRGPHVRVVRRASLGSFDNPDIGVGTSVLGFFPAGTTTGSTPGVSPKCP